MSASTAIQFLYTGDCFEENPKAAYGLADRFKARGIKAIMLHDSSTGDAFDRMVFEEIARRTGGVCIDFPTVQGSMDDLRDVFSAVAVPAYGGVKLREQARHHCQVLRSCSLPDLATGVVSFPIYLFGNGCCRYPSGCDGAILHISERIDMTLTMRIDVDFRRQRVTYFLSLNPC